MNKILGRHIIEIVRESSGFPKVKLCDQQARKHGYTTTAFGCAVQDWWEGYWHRSEYRSKKCDLPENMMGRKILKEAERLGYITLPELRDERLSRAKISIMPGVSIPEIMSAQKCLCACCGVDLITKGNYHLDHIQPLARGGMNVWWNLQFLCQCCNSIKSDKDPYQWADGNGIELPYKFTSMLPRK